MAKKEDLMSGFGQRIQGGSPAPRKENEETLAGEQTISAQEKERRSRAGRRFAWDKSPRATDMYAYTSLALNSDTYEQIREIARLNALPIRDIINAALKKYVELYEEKNGPVTSPRESKISADSLI